MNVLHASLEKVVCFFSLQMHSRTVSVEILQWPLRGDLGGLFVVKSKKNSNLDMSRLLCNNKLIAVKYDNLLNKDWISVELSLLDINPVFFG